MPLISRLGAASSRGFGEFNQQAAGQYIEDYFSTYLYTGNGGKQTISNGVALSNTASWSTVTVRQGGVYLNSVATDSSGNFCLAGTPNDGSTYAFLGKYNSSGVSQWQIKLRDGGGYGNSVVFDSSGNTYLTGNSNDPTEFAFVAKLDSSGNLLWQRKLRQNSGRANGNSVAVDSSGNVYATGYANDGSNYTADYAYIVKYNSSGSLQWQRKFRLSGYRAQGLGLVLDNSANVYVTGSSDTGSGYTGFLVKYDTSGTIQWQRRVEQGTTDPRSVTLDASGNIFVAGRANDGAQYAFLAKYNSSGTLQWQRKVRQGSASSSATGVSCDSSGNAYLVGDANDSVTFGFVIKYDTSGTVQWQREIRGTTSAPNVNLSAVSVDALDNVRVCGQNPGTTDYGICVTLKADGSTVSGSAFVILLLGSLASTSAGLSDSAGSFTDSAGTVTDSASTLSLSSGTATLASYTQAAVTGAGGLVWSKVRSTASDNQLYDTSSGATKALFSNRTDAQTTLSTGLTAFNSNGYSIGSLSGINSSGQTFTSWTFRKAPKFFDVVTWSGNSTNRTISHSLGSVPGMIIVKRTDSAADWQVYHRSLANTEYAVLNTTAAKATGATRWNSTTATDTVFSLGTDSTVNATGGSYVAYLFAHNAGGFGADGSQNVISCGSFTTSNGFVNLGFEPQFFLYKNSTDISDWIIADNMRGWNVYDGSNTNGKGSNANTNGGEYSWYLPSPGSKGVTPIVAGTYIYMAIRRGPMRTPTSGTSVFSPTTSTGTGATRTITTGFPVDLFFGLDRPLNGNNFSSDRLTSAVYAYNYGANPGQVDTNSGQGVTLDNNTGFGLGTGAFFNTNAISYVYWAFQRAPSVFDVVAYTGTGSNATQSHNLGVPPELMIVHARSVTDWQIVYAAPLGNTKYLFTRSTNGEAVDTTMWNSTSPTATQFSLGTNATVNQNGTTYVAYLFASCSGVSKVGSYTGTGATQTIECGFTGGARFVLIKRTDTTGSWYIWDTARGMVAGTDPYLLLNSTAAEVNTNSVYTTTGGFQIVSTAADINANGGSYIYLAMA